MATSVVTSTIDVATTTVPSVLGDRPLGADHVVVQAADQAPVWVRVKKAIGMRCTLSNSADAQVVDQALADASTTASARPA